MEAIVGGVIGILVATMLIPFILPLFDLYVVDIFPEKEIESIEEYERRTDSELSDKLLSLVESTKDKQVLKDQ